MIKFLRDIKQNKLKSGQIKSYLTYAIGEIFLVVIGILIAVQVNNWNQKRVENKKELKALIDLKGEFINNKKRIEDKQNKRLFLGEVVEKYLNLNKNKQVTYDDFLALDTVEIYLGMTNPSFGVINTLISSGEINLISNDSLKYLLTDWKDQAGNLLENENILWVSTGDYSNYKNRFLPSLKDKWVDWPKEILENKYNKLKYEIQYRNFLASFDGALKAVNYECEQILKDLNRTISLLQKEIDKKI